MYHESYRHHKNIDATSEDAGVIREILNFMCIDADLSAGWEAKKKGLKPWRKRRYKTCDFDERMDRYIAERMGK